ncbi:MAG: DUF748 domain-containing protein [Desulfobulbaceae bacterium]|nr:DUF748 domain-containing protein [Desulfobulbaceae bacterium]
MIDNDKFGHIPIAGGDFPAEEKIPPIEPKTAPGHPSAPSPRKRRQLPSSNRKLAWLTGLITLAALLFVAIGYGLVPYLTTTLLANRLGAKLDRSVTIAKADFDPFSLTLTLHNCIIGPRLSQKEDQVDPVLSFATAKIDLEAIGLVTGKIITKSLEAEQLFVHLVRNKNGGYNLLEMAQQAWPQATAGHAPAYSLNNIAIRESRLIFDDQPAGKSHSVTKINLALPSLSNISYQTGQYIKPELSGEINGSPISLTGETSVRGDTLEAKLAVKLSGIDLPGYLVYLPEQFRFKATRGSADIDGDLILAFTPGKEIALKYTGVTTLADLSILDREGNVNTIGKATVRGVIAPLQQSYLLDEIEIVKPEIHLDKNKDGHWNLPKIIGPDPKNSASPQKKPTLTIKQLLLTNGTFHLTDRLVNGGFQDTWTEIQCSIKDYGNQPTTPAAFAVSGASNAKARFSAQGTISSSPFKAEGLLVVDKIGLETLNPYLKTHLQLQINSGLISKYQSRFVWQPAGDKQTAADLRFFEISAQLEKLLLSRNDNEWLRLPEISLKEADLDLANKTINLGKIKASGGSLLMAWDNKGRLNWQDLQAAPNPPAWQLNFTSLQAEGTTIAAKSDSLASTPVSQTFRDLSFLLVAGAKNSEKGKLKASANLDGKGTIMLEGDLDLAPLRAELSCRVQDYRLVALQPFFKDRLKPRISSGLLNARGQLTYPVPTYSGSIEISDFAATDNKKPVMAADKIIAAQSKISGSPLRLQIDSLQVDGPRLSWIHAPKKSAADTFFPKTGKQEAFFEIAQLSFNQGTVDFSDLFLSPPYSAVIDRVSGSISGLANQADNLCHLDLTGTLEKKAPIIIAGDFSFFAPQPAIRCQVGLAGVALNAIEPYSEPVFGYHFAAGTMKVAAIVERQGDNLVVNSQFAFDEIKLGARTGGTIQLPMTLALVTDENNRFTFNLSSRGNLKATDDFSYRKSISKHIRTLLAKATVSPFAVLKESLPEQPLPSAIAFKPGLVALTPDHHQALNQLRHLLKKRPQLLITLTGTADDLGDRKALLTRLQRQEDEKRRKKEAQLSNKLSATYGKEEIAPASAPLPTPVITEEIVYDESSITKESLLQLGENRANAVKKYMEESLAVAPARLKIMPPRLVDAANPSPEKSRVDFGLELYTPQEPRP